MKIVSAKQSREIDKKTIEEFGLPGLVLMERAALSVISIVEKNYPDLIVKGRVLIFTGTGNNGGDGLAIARLLFSQKTEVSVILVGDENKRTPDNLLQLSMVKKLGVPCFSFSKEIFRNNQANLIIDALFGSGLARNLSGEYLEAIKIINETRALKLAVDVPSGINGDTGEIMGDAVMADLTVTFAFPKTGLLMDQALDHTGELEVVDIGIPQEFSEEIETNLLTDEKVSKIIRKRKRAAFKNQFGRLCLIGGSKTMSGAVVLAAKAALKTGVGLLDVLVPKSIQQIVATQIPTAMVTPLSEKDGFVIKDPLIFKYLELADTLVIGPGLGTEPETMELLTEICQSFSKPLLIDADGLNILSQKINLLRERKAPTIITPHPGELSRILGIDSKELQRDRLKAVRVFREKYQAILVFKGARSIICQQEQEIWINSCGSPALARGGSGDLLSGMIGSLLAQKYEPFSATLAGVYLHAKMGELAGKELNENTIITEELLDFVTPAFKKILSQK